MKIFERIAFFFLTCVMLCYCNVKNDTNKSEKFIPTNEWQVIKKGQPIPKGLHVRVNFETGVTEAKLMDSSENDVKSLSVVQEDEKNNKTQNSTSSTSNKKYSRMSTLLKDELKEALKNIPGDTLEPTPNVKHRTLEEIRSEFKKLKMDMKTDNEIIHELFERYELIKKFFPQSNQMKEKLEQESIDGPASAEILNILTDLEHLVHTYDNGLEFIRLQGLEKMVYPHLNSTDNTIKAEAIKLLGSSIQHNIGAQIHALETNAGELLLKILALDKNEHVKAKAMYALGCLVRQFPLAQKQVISKHGMDVLTKLLLSDNPAFVKLKIKILVLLEDLVLEHKSVLEKHIPGDPIEEEKLRQYYQVDLMSKLSNPAFCEILSKLLQEYFEYDSTNIDNMDKIFSVIETFSHICKHHHYKDTKLLILFHKMQTFYGKIIAAKVEAASSEDSAEDTEFYTNILKMIENYLNILNETKIKDEL